MTFVGDEHVDAEHEDGMPDKGRALVRPCEFAPGVVGPMVWFRCPRGDQPAHAHRLYCGVPAKPSPPNSRGCAWEKSGPDDAPTLTPSVNCNGVGCGWHGFIRAGKTEDA